MEIAEFHNAVKSRARMSFRNYRNFVSIARIFAIASLDVLRKETSIRDRYRRGGGEQIVSVRSNISLSITHAARSFYSLERADRRPSRDNAPRKAVGTERASGRGLIDRTGARARAAEIQVSEGH